MILVMHFLKIINMMKSTKKNEEKSKSQPEETIAERVKLGRQMMSI